MTTHPLELDFSPPAQRHSATSVFVLKVNDSKFDVKGFCYDPLTGAISKDGRRRDADNGLYWRVEEKTIRVLSHRLAWRLHHGEWPGLNIEIDHRNLDKKDNRITNLRLSTRSQNIANGNAMKNCKSGERGVYLNKGRWCIRVALNGTRFQQLASHKISAIVAARLIRRVLHGEFAA